MLGMVSPFEMLIVVIVGVVLLASSVLGVYLLVKRAARDGARDAARTPKR
jgi:hypothetical protein